MALGLIYENNRTANELAEPIQASLFQATIFPNASVVGVDIELLQEEIKSISGLDAFEKVPVLVEQKTAGGVTRTATGVVVDNKVEATFNVNVNLRGEDGTHATNLITLKRMKDKQFNRATGERGLKKDCAFKVVINQHTKDDKIWRIITLENCMFGEGGITGLDEVNIETDDAAVLSFTVISDKNSVQYADSI